ncbi:uncharacterized protein J4E79_002554 [Alternaria viburni]|uniref:uncharacterized protein n=1 Tax=Alternaria viburni TaxID=566460 RepID=UPI0020C29D5B|nr:uncharacterized protein J4E79_002554 [Alternaria viburni]KAI4666515.1 hypothetical protein J4E79_002554 [Alternaria viburni]
MLLGFVIFYTVLAWLTFFVRCKHFSGFWDPNKLSLGYVAVVMGIVKTVYQLTIVKDNDSHFNNNVRFWGFVQLNVGIIAASIPTLKPLLRKISKSTNSNQYNQFHDGDKARTIGSAPPSRPRKSILTTLSGTRTDKNADTEAYEMWRATAGSAQGGKNEIYAVSEERAGSEDYILGGHPHDSKQIKCTTEVTINNEGTNSRV